MKTKLITIGFILADAILLGLPSSFIRALTGRPRLFPFPRRVALFSGSDGRGSAGGSDRVGPGGRGCNGFPSDRKNFGHGGRQGNHHLCGAGLVQQRGEKIQNLPGRTLEYENGKNRVGDSCGVRRKRQGAAGEGRDDLDHHDLGNGDFSARMDALLQFQSV